MRKVLVVFLGMVLMVTLAMGLTATVSAQEALTAPPAWFFDAKAPEYASSQFTTQLLASDVKECPGEPKGTCWTARAQREVVIDEKTVSAFMQFAFQNKSTCRMDGYYLDPITGKMTTGIPSGKDYWTEGFTYRPLECSGSVTTTATVAPVAVTPVFTGVVSSKVGLVNVRSTPMITDTNIITQIVNGVVVSITAESGDWYEINYPIDGYVYKPLIVVKDPTTSSVSSHITALAPPCVTVSAPITWTIIGNDVWAWNAFKDNGGVFVEMELKFNEDGEFVVDGKGSSPIPAGKHVISGATVDCMN